MTCPDPSQVHTAVVPHLVVDDAAAAIDFYVKAFDATEMARIPGPDGKLIHAAIVINGSMIFLNDDFPETCGGTPSTPTALGGSPVTIHVQLTEVDRRFQQAVDAGATVVMPPEDQFWGDRYCQVRDPFGHLWSLAETVREVSFEELSQAAGQPG